MKSVFYVLLGALLLTGCAGKTDVRPDQLVFPELVFELPEVEHVELANGLQLYMLADHELPLVDVTVTVGGGSIFDEHDKAGVSSLFATLLETGGAGDRSPLQLEEELERMAAELSVGRSAYATTISLSLRSQDLQRGLAILADLLRRPRFDPERLEVARNKIREGIRRRNDEPASVAGWALARSVYGDHPFGRHATLETVARIERDDLLNMHRRYFHPDNIWLSVAGDVAPETFRKQLEEVLGDWRAAGVVLPDPPPYTEPPESNRTIFVEKDVPQTTILMGHRGIEKNNPDMYALRVANFILGGGGFNSRMMREIRSNRGLAYSVYSYFEVGRRLPEMFVAGSETKCASTIEVAGVMLDLIRQLREEPVSQEELELAKQSLINSFVFAFDSSRAVVDRRVRIDYYGYPEGYLERYRERIAAVTIEDVQRVARTYLRPDQMQIVLVGRSAEFDQDPTALGCPVEQVDPDGLQQSVCPGCTVTSEK
ncbi:MAG: pitrilysin family protein [Desulfuromonadales bacterium]|nr:pitrilysin family protein [Desulfuromonadales bacterium]